jgi:hypothetical protein
MGKKLELLIRKKLLQQRRKITPKEIAAAANTPKGRKITLKSLAARFMVHNPLIFI